MAEMTPTQKMLAAMWHHTRLALSSASHRGITSSCFRISGERDLYDAIRMLFVEQKPINLESVRRELREMGAAIDDELINAVSSARINAQDVDDIVLAVRDEYIEDRISEASEKACNRSLWKTTMDAVNYLSSELVAIAKLGNMTVDIEQLSRHVIEDVEKVRHGVPVGIPMPWEEIRKFCGSPEPGQLCVVGGHGGSGKSLLVLQWALHLALQGWSVMLFSLEDTARVALRRMACQLSGMSGHCLRLGVGTEEQYKEFYDACRRIAALGITIIDTISGVNDIVTHFLQFADNDKSVIFIDAFKDIPKPEGVDGENATIAALAKAAKQIGVPVIVTHHVRKPPPQTKSRHDIWHIDAADLRGSGRIWDDARYVLLLQKYPKSQQKSDCERDEEFDFYLHVAKANHGMAGVLKRVVLRKHLVWELDPG